MYQLVFSLFISIIVMVDKFSDFRTGDIFRVVTAASFLLCLKECYDDAQCVSASYSDAKQICHLQMPSTNPSCGAIPFRRWVKTEIGCRGVAFASWSVDYDRTNLTREMGLDPCYPDKSLIHPELLKLDGISPPCPVNKLDGPGPVYTFRGLNIDGTYQTWGTNNLVQAFNFTDYNTWAYKYGSTFSFWHRFVAAYCVEIGGECSCVQFGLYGSGTRPLTNVMGACPNQRLYMNRQATIPAVADIDGNTAMIFCSGGRWLAADADGNSYTLLQASCA